MWPDGVNELIAKNILETRKRLRNDTSQGEEKAGKKARKTCLQVFAIDSDSDISDTEACEVSA